MILKNSFCHLSISPQLGGSLVGFSLNDAPSLRIFRQTPEKADHAGKASMFMLAPYSNRLKDHTFQFNEIKYPLNGNAIHGILRDNPMSVVQHSDDRLELTFDTRTLNKPFNFPFHFQVTLIYQLLDDGFQVSYVLANKDKVDFPAGFGFHPYFNHNIKDSANPQQQVAHLHFNSELSYQTEEKIPVGDAIKTPEVDRFKQGIALTDYIDNTFSNWDRKALIKWPELDLTLTASEALSHLIAFSPNTTHFAVEPVSHCVDGFNRQQQGFKHHGIKVIKPNEHIHGEMCFAFTLAI